MAATSFENVAGSSLKVGDRTVIADMGVRKPVAETLLRGGVYMMPMDEEATTPMPFSISKASGGEVTFVFSGASISAICDVLNLEIRVNNINIGVLAGGDELLVPGVPKLGSLHPIGDNLIAGTASLPPGNYTVLLRRSWNAEGSRIDANGDGASLTELGEAGVVLNIRNCTRVLDEMDTALGPILGQTVRRILELPLNTAYAVEGSALETMIAAKLDAVGLSGSRQKVLDTTVTTLLEDARASAGHTPMVIITRGHAFAPQTIGGSVLAEQCEAGQHAECGGEMRNVAPGIVVTHVWKSDVAPVALTDGTAQIAGDHGVLVIKADGSYLYTPKGSVESLGQTEHFSYLVADGTETKLAELGITLHGGLAADDSAFAGIEYQHVKTQGRHIDDAIDHSWTGVSAEAAGAAESLTSETITVEPHTTQDLMITLDADSAMPLGASLSIRLEMLKAMGWVSHAWLSNDQLVSLMGSGLPAQFVIPDLAVGDYRIKVEPRFNHATAVGRINVDVDSTVTHLDQVEVSSVFPARGNLFDNDLPGAAGTLLRGSAEAGEISGGGDGPMVMQGAFGSLEFQADGSYTYTPDARAGFGRSTDTFVYQIARGNACEEAVLKVQISGTLEGNIQAVGRSEYLVLKESDPLDESLLYYDLFGDEQEKAGVVRREVLIDRPSDPLGHPATGIEQELDIAGTNALA